VIVLLDKKGDNESIMFDNLLRGPLLSQTKPTGDATCLLFLIRPNAAISHWPVIFKAATSIVILI